MGRKEAEGVLQYHEATKHHVHRLARSSGYMDWANEPDPFRFYSTEKRIRLPVLNENHEATHADLFLRRNHKVRPFTLSGIAGFLELSLALSAWKQMAGTRWSLRINPSSGNLHPTEAHLILPAMDACEGGVYHYDPLHHALEQRASIPGEVWEAVRRHFKMECFFIGLSSIFWRESWKYGERAFRYCNHDIGHALAALSFSANLQGWRVKALTALSDDDLDTLLGFDRTAWVAHEQEHPDLLCAVCPGHAEKIPGTLPEEMIFHLSKADFAAKPNTLSKEHVAWPIIDNIAVLTRKQRTVPIEPVPPSAPFLDAARSFLNASDIIRLRRSGVGYDRAGIMPGNRFRSILDKTIPRPGCAPFDVDILHPSTHLLLFVHRVEGLDRGLYFLFRNLEDVDAIKKLSCPDFLWEQVDETLPLYLLRPGGVQGIAIRVSCDQDIAGAGCFSLGMISRFRKTVEESPYLYRNLFWETGIVGQVLYLEAEAYGFRGTGIGCFYDDEVHRIMGWKNDAYQSLYHFTIGKPLEDPRLTTYAPYAHLKQENHDENPLHLSSSR